MKTILLALIFAILLEASVTTLPLTLLIILFLAVINKNNEVFLIAFFSGLFLDLLSLDRLGVSSLYFTVFVFIIYIYQKKFEIETLYFMIIFSFIGSLIYLLLMGTGFIFLQSTVATIISVSSFLAYKKFNKKAPKYA